MFGTDNEVDASDVVSLGVMSPLILHSSQLKENLLWSSNLTCIKNTVETKAKLMKRKKRKTSVLRRLRSCLILFLSSLIGRSSSLKFCQISFSSWLSSSTSILSFLMLLISSFHSFLGSHVSLILTSFSDWGNKQLNQFFAAEVYRFPSSPGNIIEIENAVKWQNHRSTRYSQVIYNPRENKEPKISKLL